MIKYLGSKRRLVPILGAIADASGARTALDLFSGTTRVAQEFKRRGIHTTAVDVARYSELFARTYIELDGEGVDREQLRRTLAELDALPGDPGYFTETFCEEARFFQPHNGARVDAIRDVLAGELCDDPLWPVYMTSLILAADRVDSTTGVQMAYVKQWAPRSFNDLELRIPELLSGTGTALRCDARAAVRDLSEVDLAYLDPPYNQHRYFTNYHVWETLVAWDSPPAYGVARKRIDCRDDATKSVFNRKREMPGALREVVASVRASTVVLSYNDESWIELPDLVDMMSARGEVAILAFDSKRYVGAQIGVHAPSGERVGDVSHLRNTEYVLIAGEPDVVDRMRRAAEGVELVG